MDADQALSHAIEAAQPRTEVNGVIETRMATDWAQVTAWALVSIALRLAPDQGPVPTGAPGNDAELRTADATEALVHEVATIRLKLHQ